MLFYTVGHSTRDLDDLIAIIETDGAWPLIDIRTYPGSRRYPHFDKEYMGAMLGRRYVHIPELGGRRKAERKDSRNGGWRHSSFRRYADHMETAEFETGMRKLTDLGTGTLMCSEAVWWRCHRRMVSDALLVAGHRVLHIGGAFGEHELTDFAEVEPDLHYPPPQSSLF